MVLKSGEYRKRICGSIEAFVDIIANCSPPLEAYCALISVQLITLDKQPGIRLVGVGEIWRHISTKFFLRVPGPEATIMCHYEHMSDGLKAGLDGAVHGVQDIWDNNLTKEDWGFLIVDNLFCSIRSIKSEFCGQFEIYGHPELPLFLVAIITGHCSFCITGMGQPVFCTVERV